MPGANTLGVIRGGKAAARITAKYAPSMNTLGGEAIGATPQAQREGKILEALGKKRLDSFYATFLWHLPRRHEQPFKVFDFRQHRRVEVPCDAESIHWQLEDCPQIWPQVRAELAGRPLTVTALAAMDFKKFDARKLRALELEMLANEKASAIQHLALTKSPQAWETVMRHMQHPRAEVRKGAANAVVWMAGQPEFEDRKQEASDALAAQLEADRSVFVRAHLVERIAAHGDRGHVPVLIRTAKASQSPFVRMQCMKALGKMTGMFNLPAAARALQAGLKDRGADVRGNALLALAEGNYGTAKPAILKALGSRRTEIDGQYAVRALRRALQLQPQLHDEINSIAQEAWATLPRGTRFLHYASDLRGLLIHGLNNPRGDYEEVRGPGGILT